MSGLVRSSTDPPPQKRRRQQQSRQQQQQVQQQVQVVPQRPFLKTHLLLLRTLHANDDLESTPTNDQEEDRCARPSWVEVNSFIEKQVMITEIDEQRQRATAILRALRGSRACGQTVSGDDGQADHPVLRLAAQEAEAAVTVPAPRPDRVATCQALHFSHSQRFHPAAAVSGVLRRAAKDRAVERNSVCAALSGLKLAVKRTIDDLGSSLGALSRAQHDSCTATTRRRRREDDMTTADLVEREGTKLLLWRRLQSSISALEVPAAV